MDNPADIKRRRNLDKHPGIHRLNELASEYPGGDLHVQKAVNLKTGRWFILWEIDFQSDSFFIFNNSGCIRDTLDEAIEAELEQLEERLIMNIYGTKLFPYLQGEMIQDKRITMHIKEFEIKELKNSKRTDDGHILYFHERDKGLVLNKTNARIIAGLYGPDTDDWIGKPIKIYAIRGEWFGQAGWAIRVSDEHPTNGIVPENSVPVQQPVPEDTGPSWDDLEGQDEASGNDTDWRSKLQKGRQSLATVCSVSTNGIPTVNSDEHALAILEKHYDIPEQYTDTWKWEMSQGVTQEFAVKMYDFIDEHERQKVDD